MRPIYLYNGANMNVKYEAEYKKMLESCNKMNCFYFESKDISNAFHLIESHLREQFTYDFNLPPEPLVRDNNIINSLLAKLEKVCEEASKAIKGDEETLNYYWSLREKEGSHTAYMREMNDTQKDIFSFKKFRYVEIMVKFIKEFLLPIPQGQKFPLFIFSNFGEVSNSEFRSVSGSVSGTVSSSGKFNGTYNPGGTYTVKGQNMHSFLFLTEKMYNAFPMTYFFQKQHKSSMVQLYSNRTFKTDLGYDLEKGGFFAIIECTPRETDPMFQSVVQGLVDSEHFGLWQAHAKKNFNSVQGQQPKKTGFLGLFGESRPTYSPFNYPVKKFLEREFTQLKQLEESEKESREKEREEWSKKISEAHMTKFMKELEAKKSAQQ